MKNSLSSQVGWFISMLLAAVLFSSCGNCPDYPLDPDLARFFPYQANQSIVFEDANQNLDTIQITAYSRGNQQDVCKDNQNRTFLFEVVHVLFGNISGDSLFLYLDNTAADKMSVRFAGCCDLGNAYNPMSGTLDAPISTNYETFSFLASEVVNGTTYQNVATHGRTAEKESHIRTVKVAMDYGVVAFETDQGVWWYLR